MENLAFDNRIVFDSFDSPNNLVSNPSIEPKFDGMSIKIGDFSCVLVDSCKNLVNYDDFVFEDDIVFTHSFLFVKEKNILRVLVRQNLLDIDLITK